MSRRAGLAAEQRARAELERHGLRLLESNFSSRHGELDLIMQDGESLVFVEVRMRRADGHGSAEASITATKRQRLVRTAALWLQRHPALARQPCRFDVVSCDGLKPGDGLRWIRAAFEAD